jgi:D-amino-acid oxidase
MSGASSAQSIAVIGSGVIGLSIASRLAPHASVTLYTADDLQDTTSSRAGAVFSAFDAAELTTVLQDSARIFAALAHSDPASGVTLRPSREYAPPARWQAPPAWTHLVARTLGTTVQTLPPTGPYAGGFRLTVPHIDITRYMPWLRQRALDGGVNIVIQRLDTLDELFDQGHAAIVNASGLGARTLAPDPAVRPMRGQVLHVPNTLGLTEALDAAEPDGHITYVYPFANHVVLGGTYEQDIADCRTDEPTLLAIIDRCRRLLALTGEHRADQLGQTRLRTLAGLRPTRVLAGKAEAVRIERVETSRGPIVHAYGHGRAGITLSWGTAEAVATLLSV